MQKLARRLMTYALVTSLAIPQSLFAADEEPAPPTPAPVEDPQTAPAAALAPLAAASGYDEFDASAVSMTDAAGVAGDKVNPFTGELIVRAVDLSVPGNGGMGLQVIRFFRSQSGNVNENFGYRWNMHYGRVGGGSGNCPDGDQFNVIFETNDGGLVKLIGNRGSTSLRFISRERFKAACESGAFTVYGPNGTTYTMGSRQSDGYLYVSRITDRNGNTIDVSYTGGTRVASVSASDGRSVQFTYNSDKVLTSMAFNGNGTVGTWTYGYATQIVKGKSVRTLASVKNPEGLTTSYNYRTQTSPTVNAFTITTPGNTVIKYTFSDRTDMGEVVAKKEVSGGSVAAASWTYDYKVPADGLPRLTTTITSPSRKLELLFDRGANSFAYMVGALLKQSVLKGTTVLETTEFTWSKQSISETAFSTDTVSSTGPVRVSDVDTFAPLLTQKKITRFYGTKSDVFTTKYLNYNSYGAVGRVEMTGVGAGASKILTRTYELNTAKWILNLPLQDSITGAGNIVRAYDNNGNLTSISKFGVETIFTYTTEGDVASTTAADGIVTSYADYKRGLPTSTIYNSSAPQEDQLTESATINGFGKPTRQVDRRGYAMSTTYDKVGRILTITPPGDFVASTYTYPSATQVRISRGSSYSQTSTLDGLGRVISKVDGGIRQTFSYDAEGRLIKKSYLGASSGTLASDTMSYDEFDRLKSVKHPNGKTITYAFDVGNVVKVTDQDGFVTTNSYRGFSPSENILLRVSNSQVTTEITRDVLGLVTAITQYKTGTTAKVTRTFAYSAKKYLTSKYDPELGTEQNPGAGVTNFTVDSLGRTLQEKRGSSAAIVYSYDAFGRMRTRTVNGVSTTFSYDNNGNLTQVVHPNATRTYTYNALNQQVRESLSVGGGTPVLSQTFERNTLGNISKITYPGGLTVTLKPNARGFATSVLPFVNNVTYAASGQVGTIAFANGKNTNFTYDSQMRLTNLTTTGVSNIDLTFNGRNQPLTMTDTATDAVASRRTIALDYDSAGRMTKANGDWGVGSTSYDGAGNILSLKLGNTRTLSYGKRQLPLTVTGGSITHDNRANLSGIDSRTNVFDGTDSLTSVKVGANTINYVYDGSQNLVRRTDGGTSTVYFVNSSNRLIGQYRYGSGQALFEYAYLGGTLVGVQSDSAQYTLVTDPRGAVIAVNDVATPGVTRAKSAYTPYGDQISLSGDTQQLVGNVGFQGFYQDPKTGYVSAGVRWFYPSIGRFLSMDPVHVTDGNQDSFNRFSYAGNNPISFTDPTGKNPAAIPVLIGGMWVLGMVAMPAVVSIGRDLWEKAKAQTPDAEPQIVYRGLESQAEYENLMAGKDLIAPGVNPSFINHVEGKYSESMYISLTGDFQTAAMYAAGMLGHSADEPMVAAFNLALIEQRTKVYSNRDLLAAIANEFFETNRPYAIQEWTRGFQSVWRDNELAAKDFVPHEALIGLIPVGDTSRLDDFSTVDFLDAFFP